MTTLNAVIQLRRDNDYNFKKVENSFIPANGEVILVDTAKDGLRAKVGNGFSTFAQLQYTDNDIRNTVQQGYYFDNLFYKTETKQTILQGMINKIYIDIPTRKLYYYNGQEYILINSNNMPIATSEEPGIIKLYNTTGDAVDGTMTQKAISDELDLRYKASVDSDDELLIFSF